ncbi:MAG: hypothetical protein Q9218_008013 [Villophora microphyllina]
MNLEIEKGDTYPMISEMPLTTFGPYWFQNFAAIMILGEAEAVMSAMVDFLSRKRPEIEVSVGSWVKGYTYSVFNLVYETNVASCRIWDALGFKRVGRIKGCGNLRSYPDEFVDAIIYGRDLGPEGEDFVSEERFDKIRFYLKHGKYPDGADRAEKSRLRSAATHYKLIPTEDGTERGERLMLKDKEVVSDPQRQYEIARQVHAAQHGGINKTTATIAEKYHWVRIKETVSLVIKNCLDCKESIRPASTLRSFGDNQPPSGGAQLRSGRNNGGHSNSAQDPNALIERLVDFTDLQSPSPATDQMHHGLDLGSHHPQSMSSIGDMHHGLSSPSPSPFDGLPVDPQIMHTHSPSSHHHSHQSQHPSQDAHHQSFEDQLRQATHGTPPSHSHFGDLDDHLASPHHHLSPSPNNIASQPDTRLATGRHVRQEQDEPMAFIHEPGDGEEGAFEMEAKAREEMGDDEDIDGDAMKMHDSLVDFDGRGV